MNRARASNIRWRTYCIAKEKESALLGIADDILLQFPKAVVFLFLLQPFECLPHNVASKEK